MHEHASHSIVCNAPPDAVYDVIRRSEDWPAIFSPCRKVSVLVSGPDEERIEVTAEVNGHEMIWRSHRRFQLAQYGVTARIVEPMKLVAAMTTTWRVVLLNAGQSLLLLEHDYDLCEQVEGQVPDVRTGPEAARFIARAIDGNSTAELNDIKAAVERPAAHDPLVRQHARHTVICHADPDLVYSLVRDTSVWPRIFDACLGASVVDGDPTQGAGERVRIEALQEGLPVVWDTDRVYFDGVRRIEYSLPAPMPFVESMAGEWRVLPLGPDRCVLTVDRRWRMLADVSGIRQGIDTVEQAAALVRDFVERNAQAEMEALRAYAETSLDTLTTVETRVRLPHSPDAVYALLADLTAWPDMLPHCRALRILYDDARFQEFLMTVQSGQATEEFRSMRLCDEQRLRIDYFQPQPPPALRRHTGSWQVLAEAGGCEVVARHTAVLDPDAARQAFGTEDVRTQKERVRELLGGNSHQTILAVGRRLAEQTASLSRRESRREASVVGRSG